MCLGEAVAVGRHGTQHLGALDLNGMEIDAIEIIAGLLRRYGKACLVDQMLEIGGGHGEFVGEFAGGQIGEVLRRQGLQGKPRAAGDDCQPALVRTLFELDLRTVRQFAHDVIHHVGRNSGGTLLAHFSGNRLHHFDIQIGGGEANTLIGSAQQDVGQNGDGVAPFNHTLDVVEGLQQSRALNRDAHLKKPFLA